MADWIALSDRYDPMDDAGADLLEKGALILELELPLAGPQVLLDYHGADGWMRGVSVFHDPRAGIRVLHRQGDSVVHHSLAGPLPQDQGIARLTLRWDAPARWWSLRYEGLETGLVMDARGVNPLPLPMADVLAMCRGACKRHPSVLWFGATRGNDLPDRAPWIGLRTPIATPHGLRHASSLQVGDAVLTLGGVPRGVQSVRRMDLPSRGYFAPVLLRAPYFGHQIDLLVSADQLVALSGPEVEYLFAEDEVLAQARHLTDGRSALLDQRRAVTSCVSIDLGQPEIMLSEGCALVSASHTKPAPLPRRLLYSYEVVPLLALLGRGNGRRAA